MKLPRRVDFSWCCNQIKREMQGPMKLIAALVLIICCWTRDYSERALAIPFGQRRNCAKRISKGVQLISENVFQDPKIKNKRTKMVVRHFLKKEEDAIKMGAVKIYTKDGAQHIRRNNGYTQLYRRDYTIYLEYMADGGSYSAAGITEAGNDSGAIRTYTVSSLLSALDFSFLLLFKKIVFYFLKKRKTFSCARIMTTRFILLCTCH